ncbi:MAG: 3-deoxy-D-manno-octulosonic acid transferase, partial [Pseudomonadota bacterium]|nr:3-deoxy-D-manno-octulosonic acid transferase [Pseudomonadota bacterium]
DRLRPELAVIMETEIWPNLLRGCARRSIPVLFANVRLSEKSYRGYARFRSLFAPRLREVDAFAVQAEPDAERLIRLGARAESVHVTGSIKFDIRLPASVSEAAQSVRRELGRARPVWVAGSTHEGEEAALLELLGPLQKQHPRLLLVLVPRHPERFAGVSRLSARLGLRTARRSETRGPLGEGIEVYVGDTMGELPLLIAAGDAAFIGGSLVDTGGHNILEACAAGVPVLFGPHMFNFKQIAEMVVEQGAGVQVLDAGELEEVVNRFLHDAELRDRYGGAGLALIDQNRGALERIYVLLLEIWPE